MKKVLLVDSGSGGLNVLHNCINSVKGCDFLLFCDNKNLPYGNKSKQELLDMTEHNLRVIKSFFDFDVVVFACCTLTACCLKECEAIFPDVKFVGAVPPIVKAVEKYGQDKVVVLATENTIKHSEVFANYPNVKKIAMAHLAEQIDCNLNCLEVLKDCFVDENLQMKDCAVVLGCTHYNAVKDLIARRFCPVEVFDVCEEVANALKTEEGDSSQNGQMQIVTSQNDGFLAKLWQRLKEKQEDG